MIGRFVKGEEIRIKYESKRLQTGLADVTISIIKDDGNKEIDGASMSELNATNAPGVYYYKWVPTNTGTYIVYCDSTSQPRTFIDTVVIMGRESKYTQVMGVHGGMSRVTVRDTWTEIEKDKVLDFVNKLRLEQNILIKIINNVGKTLQETTRRMEYLEDSNSLFKNRLEEVNSDSVKKINEKVITLDESVIDTSAKTNKKINDLKNRQKILAETVVVINNKINKLAEIMIKNTPSEILENV